MAGIATSTVIALVALLLVATRIPLRYNVRNLVVRWRTTMIVVLAFTLVVGVLTVMLGFVKGMHRLMLGSGAPGNVVVLSELETDEILSSLSAEEIADLETLPDILRRSGRPLVSKETYLVVQQEKSDNLACGPSRHFIHVRGVEDPHLAAAVHNVELQSGGRWFSDAGVGEAPSVAPGETVILAVLGTGAARQLGESRTGARGIRRRKEGGVDVGDVFRLGGRNWLATGVMQESGSTRDCEVWAKRSLVGSVFGKDAYTTVVVRTADPQHALRLKGYLNTEYQGAVLQAKLETEYYAGLAKTNRRFVYAVTVIAVVMSVGGVFGVMNTMFSAVSERTKDIGVLRLLGYSRRQILISFLLETLFIALVGGLAGTALGSLANGVSTMSMVSSVQGLGKVLVFRVAADAETRAIGFLVAIAMGVAGGLLPAVAAMRRSALDVLRN